MAGDWIKMRHCLTNHPRVVTLASRIGVTKAHAIGALACAWFIADAHADRTGAVAMTAESLDLLVELPGFSAELQRIGWLRVGDDSLQFLNYQEHNGPTAKVRAMAQKRAQASRARNGRITPSSQNCVTREEKRREEDNTPLSPPKGGQPDNAAPANGTHKTARPRAARRSTTPTQDAIDRVFPVGGDA